MVISCCQSFIELTCCHCLHIAAWTLGVEIVPCKEIVQIIVTFSLRYYILYPSTFHFLIREYIEEHIDLVNI